MELQYNLVQHRQDQFPCSPLRRSVLNILAARLHVAQLAVPSALQLRENWMKVKGAQ
jgi:hypothetical protein